MNCPRCNSAIPAESVFCPFCGSSLNDAVYAAPVPTAEPVVAEPAIARKCINCGSPIADDDIFCGICGTDCRPAAPSTIPVGIPVVPPVVEPVAPSVPNPAPAPIADPLSGSTIATKKTKKKKGKALKITLLVTSVLLVVALVVGLCTNWYGLNGPAVQIVSAAKKTLESGSFSIEITRSYESSYYDYSRSDSISYDVNIDFENQDLTLVQLGDDNTVEFAIYDGYRIRYDEYYDYYSDSYYTGYYASDISDSIDKLFDIYESTGDFNLKDFLDELDDDAYDETKDVMDMEELEKSLKKVWGNLNNEGWLKEHAGYSKTNSDGVTTHTLHPKDLYELSSEVLGEFENAFEDEDDYEYAQDSLKNVKRQLRKVDVELAMDVEDGCLTRIQLSSEQNEYSQTIEVKIDGIGTTGIDTDTLSDLLRNAKRW